MVEQIEAKIAKHIESILRKEIIGFYDYQTLTAELARLNIKKQIETLESEKAYRNAIMRDALKIVF